MKPITVDENNVMQVSGDITYDNAMHLYQQGLESFGDKTMLTIDLSQVEHVDSAAIALLIEWFKVAKKQALSLRLKHVPKALKHLMTLSELENLAEFSESDS